MERGEEEEVSGWVLVGPTDPGLTAPPEPDGSGRPLKVTFTAPAKHWTDALPLGNGRLGAMVWGGGGAETIQLNEDTLWTGVPSNFTNPKAPEALSEVRELVDVGEYAEATSAAAKLCGNPADVYQLLGDVKLEFDDTHLKYNEGTYHRELDLDTATVTVRYAVDDVEFTREHFVSYPNQVVASKICGSKPGSLSFTVSLDSKLHHQSKVIGENQIMMEGRCPGKRIPPKANAEDNPKGIQFCTVLSLQISDGRGTICLFDDNKLRVEGSDWAVLLLVASSSFDGSFTQPSDSKKDPISECFSSLKSISNLSYQDLYARHLDDYQNLFHRVSMQLSKEASVSSAEGFKKNADDKVSTARRVESFQTDEDPSLVELLFQYGRYLLISCSRPGTHVANLQGIWNKDLEPAWDGAPHLNINLEMNYWPSLPCNLSECQEPLFDFISTLSINGNKTAKVNYGASGWVVHHKSDIWAKTSADKGDVVWALWPMGGAWLCTHLWEHYAYTLDDDFLKNKAYPLLKGCVSFLLDWLIEGPEGYLETNPSTSPEHDFIAPGGNLASVSYSSTMDMSIIKEVFSAIVSAAEVLGRTEDDIIQRVSSTQPRLYPMKIATDGSIMEWARGFKDPEVHHRHLSHLFGMFPGHTITIDKTPELCRAAEHTLHNRGEEGPGWSTTWKTALWARLQNSEHAYRVLKRLINLINPDHETPFEGGLYSNLFAAHPPFQINANFGFCAAVSEMIVQSTMNDLYLLPALPREKWVSGSVKGMRARGGVTVDICWRDGGLHEVAVSSEKRHCVKTLHYIGTVVTVKMSPASVHVFNKQLQCVNSYSLPL